MALKRALNLTFLTFYGLGTIIGAGIYALIGAVAQHANEYTPFSFLIAAIVALFTAGSYAELSSRFPESAGSALYIRKAFNKAWLSGIMGWLIVLTGLISSATLAHGFVNYINLFLPFSPYLVILILILFLGLIASLGITESAITILLMTIIEISGLLIIVWYGKESFDKSITQLNQYLPSFDLDIWTGIFSGAFIAFYAFIGFEDMVNVAEETKNPEKTIPLAIFLALIGATCLYILVALVTVFALPYKDLIQSDVPLALIIKHQGHSPLLFGLISMIAITNGILVQIIMSSRLIYGMARMNNAPKFFSNLYEKTQVPLFAIIFNIAAIIILAYWFPIETLAKSTSTIMLMIFSMMHLSLIIIKIKNPKTKNYFSLPIVFPMIGIILSISFLVMQFL